MLLPVRAEFTTAPADRSILCRVQGARMDLARHSAPELGKRGLRRKILFLCLPVRCTGSNSRQFAYPFGRCSTELLDHGDHFCCEIAQCVDANRLLEARTRQPKEHGNAITTEYRPKGTSTTTSTSCYLSQAASILSSHAACPHWHWVWWRCFAVPITVQSDVETGNIIWSRCRHCDHGNESTPRKITCLNKSN